jgi:hypothetical protein
MSNDLILLTAISFIVAPAYMIFLIAFRDGFFALKYLNPKKANKEKRVLIDKFFYNPYVLSALFFGVCIFLTLLGMALFYFVVTRDTTLLPLKNGDIFVFVGLLFCSAFLTYGVGIYIVSLTVVNDIKSFSTSSKTLSREIERVKKFRGAISHVLFSISFLFTLVFLSLLENWNLFFTLSKTGLFLCIVNGIFFGVVFAIGQYYSGTWKHQIPFVVFAFLLIAYLFFNLGSLIINSPLTIFSFICIFTILTLDLYVLFKYLINKVDYKYD